MRYSRRSGCRSGGPPRFFLASGAPRMGASTDRKLGDAPAENEIQYPIEQNTRSLAHPGYLREIYGAPHRPCKQARELMAVDLTDTCVPPHQREFADGVEGERPWRLPAQHGYNVPRHQIALARGILSGGRVSTIAIGLGNLGAVS